MSLFRRRVNHVPTGITASSGSGISTFGVGVAGTFSWTGALEAGVSWRFLYTSTPSFADTMDTLVAVDVGAGVLYKSSNLQLVGTLACGTWGMCLPTAHPSKERNSSKSVVFLSQHFQPLYPS